MLQDKHDGLLKEIDSITNKSAVIDFKCKQYLGCTKSNEAGLFQIINSEAGVTLFSQL
jgi:hypothetical protein